MPVIPLKSEQALQDVVKRSHDELVVLYKHSVTCSLSSWSYRELSTLDLPDDPPVYMVVVQERRPLSDRIAAHFRVRHESPQVIVVYRGEAVYHTSHSRVTAENVRRAVAEHRRVA